MNYKIGDIVLVPLKIKAIHKGLKRPYELERLNESSNGKNFANEQELNFRNYSLTVQEYPFSHGIYKGCPVCKGHLGDMDLVCRKCGQKIHM